MNNTEIIDLLLVLGLFAGIFGFGLLVLSVIVFIYKNIKEAMENR